jgi:hypothetical protein
MRTVYPVGTTLYQPEKCFNGYTIIWGHGRVRLIDMNGREVHGWSVSPADIGQEKGGLPRARLLPDGHVTVLIGGLDQRGGGVVEYDWDGAVVRRYTSEAGAAHHDFFPKSDGSVLLICREPVPAEAMQRVTDPERRAHTLYGDVIVEVSPEGRTVWQWHQHEHLDINHCNPIPASRDWWGGPGNNTITDWTHTNTVQALPENKWYDAGDTRFRPGNVLMSLRQLDTILIADRETGRVTWRYTGEFRGGMSGQHESCMIEKGTPGEGNILVFDNGSCPRRDLWHAASSYVLEIEPPSKRVVWVYEDGMRFHSNYTSSCQRLPNGNTLICEAICQRDFEVTPEGEIVWEFIGAENRSYRYPYDYCPQLAALPRPAELPVTPPEELRIEPGQADAPGGPQ